MRLLLTAFFFEAGLLLVIVPWLVRRRAKARAIGV